MFIHSTLKISLAINRCPDPSLVIREPRFAQSNALSDPYRWTYGFRITYTCAPGYKFPDGVTQKYTKCVEINGKLDWSIKSFPSCYGEDSVLPIL